MADGEHPPKKDNPRWSELAGDNPTEYYLARRYFQLSPAEWDAQPWWLSVLYRQGLIDQGVLDDGSGKNPRERPDKTGAQSPPSVDFAEDKFLPKGFTTRRAG